MIDPQRITAVTSILIAGALWTIAGCLLAILVQLSKIAESR
jgi:hypothetical protein